MTESKPKRLRQLTTPENFFQKVDVKEDKGACWEWKQCQLKHGYGSFCTGLGKVHHLAHRYAYEITYGPVPSGMNVLHKCDNPPCCNPDHLFLGTQADNIKDKLSKGRQPSGDRHYKSKYPEVLVRAALAAYRNGEGSQQQVADRFGVGSHTLSNAHVGKRGIGHESLSLIAEPIPPACSKSF